MTWVQTPRIQAAEAALMLEKLEAGYAVRYIAGFFGRGDVETCRAIVWAAKNEGGDRLIELVERRIEGLRRHPPRGRAPRRGPLWRVPRIRFI